MGGIRQIAFEGPLGTLRGLLHLPASADPAPAVVMLHGFTGNHVEDQFLFAQAARHLANAGFAALRFSFYGSGDSDGEFEDMTVQSEIDDAVAALDWIGQQPGIDARRIAVLGLSLGGCVTALLAGQDPRVKAAVLWNAVALPPLHFNDLPREGLDAGIRGGLRLGADFLPAFYALDIVGALRRYAGPGLVIQATADTSVMIEEADALASALGARGTLRHIQDADHTFRYPDWRREAFEITARWLAEQLTRS